MTAPVLRCMNVVYSPNLGDGLLAECLTGALIGKGASAQTTSVDLAGRTGYGPAFGGRNAMMAGLESLPPRIRGWAVRAPLAALSHRRWRPHYRAGLRGADGVVIGGGNLLSDLDLNFPTKLALALDEAGRAALPIVIYACGMGAHWSEEGLRRMRRALHKTPPRAVFLRDQASCDRWDRLLSQAAGVQAQRVRDPGLLACDQFAREPRSPKQRLRVGVGIMSDIAVRYHAHSRQADQALGPWTVTLARVLLDAEAEVCAFTNGAVEDRAAAQAMREPLKAMGVSIVQPETPHALSDLIAGFDAVVAHRMHAVIAAYSHAVPALALRWDDKLDAFMDSVGRADWLGDPAELSPQQACDRLLQAARTGLDPLAHQRVLDDARGGIDRLLAQFG